ncbi:MAG: 2-phospho-L-lactate transferase CofD family protein [Acidimicrobiia bacterium]
MRCILESYRHYGKHRVTLLAGGVGGARMARALRSVLDPGHLTVIVNVGDDTERYGVHVAADPDTVLYTLADVIGEHGWGRENDTTEVMKTLASLGLDTSFTLGDKDLGLCIARSQLLDAGLTLSETTEHLAHQLGVTDVALLPATNDPLRTFVEIEGGEWLPFQEYFVDRQHADPVRSVAYHGSAQANPANGVVDAIRDADTLVVAPSNPPLSIWPILSIDAIDSAVAKHPRRIAVSPLFGGVPLKGPADVVMRGVGLAAGTEGVLQAYADRIDVLYIDTADRDDVTKLADHAVEVIADDTRLTGPDRGAAFASRLVGGVDE